MQAMHINDPLPTLERTDEYRYIANRIVRLQERITNQRRTIEWLEATLAGAKAASFRNEDDIANMTARLAYLKNDTAQHQSELDFYVSRLERLQTDQESRGTKATNNPP
jgi:uncharacterized coiled-coil protein SlyX